MVSTTTKGGRMVEDDNEWGSGKRESVGAE